ncbi:hypothetical protein HZS_6825, partial [Henneguya salminicola]
TRNSFTLSETKKTFFSCFRTIPDFGLFFILPIIRNTYLSSSRTKIQALRLLGREHALKTRSILLNITTIFYLYLV